MITLTDDEILELTPNAGDLISDQTLTIFAKKIQEKINEKLKKSDIELSAFVDDDGFFAFFDQFGRKLAGLKHAKIHFGIDMATESEVTILLHYCGDCVINRKGWFKKDIDTRSSDGL